MPLTLRPLASYQVRFFSRGPAAGVDLCAYRKIYPCLAPEGPRRTFDGSPDYLVLPAARIAVMAQQLPPRARLIAMLRNPADRFYSAWNMGMNERSRTRGRNGSLDYRSFASTLDEMIAQAPDCPGNTLCSMFFTYGLYARHLAKYYAAFGRERVLVLRSEDFYADPNAIFGRVLGFAGLEPFEPPVSSDGASQNSGSVWGGSGYTRRLLPPERNKLSAWYAPHNRELYALIGRDMGWERPDAAEAVRAMDAPAQRVSRRPRSPPRLEL